MLSHLILHIGLILFNAALSCSAISIEYAKEQKASDVAERAEKDKKSKKRAKLINKLASLPISYMYALQLGVAIIAFLEGAFASDFFAPPLIKVLMSAFPSLSEPWAHNISVLIVAFLVCYISLLLGVILPSGFAKHFPERFALPFARLIFVSRVILAPFVFLLSVVYSLVMRIVGVDPNPKEETVTENEIKMMVDAGTESGSIDEVEQEIIKNVFEFDDISAGDIATHRTELTVLFIEEDIEEWDRIIRESKHSRIPVCEETADNVKGVLTVRDYFLLDDKTKENILDKAVRPAYLVPESAKADVLFRNMKQKKEFLAIVLDEYGGTLGVITMNDLIECLIGEFNTADDEVVEESKIEKIGDNTWQVVGKVMMSDLEDELDMNITDIDSDTFSGFVLGLYGNIPEDGTTFDVETENLYVHVLEIKDRVVEKAEISLKHSDEEDLDIKENIDDDIKEETKD